MLRVNLNNFVLREIQFWEVEKHDLGNEDPGPNLPEK